MAFYFARIWLTDSAAKLVLIAAVLVAKISAANSIHLFYGSCVHFPKAPFRFALNILAIITAVYF